MSVQKMNFNLTLEVGEEFFKVMMSPDILHRQKVMDDLVMRMQERLCSEEGSIRVINRIVCTMTHDQSSFYDARKREFDLKVPTIERNKG